MGAKSTNKSEQKNNFREEIMGIMDSAIVGISEVFIQMPNNPVNEFYAGKLLSSAVSTNRVYDYSQIGGKSEEEFLSSLRKSHKFANDGLYYLNLAIESGVVKETDVKELRKNMTSVAKMLGSSISTVRKKIKGE